MKQVFIYGDRETWKNYSDAVEGVGGSVVFSNNIEDAFLCDGLLLTGGADINPKYYCQANTASEGEDNERDKAELKLVEMFCKADKPILGICRGHQIITVALGGTLIQDVENKDKHSRNGAPYDKTHLITTEKGSYINTIYGDCFMVNSAHHQAADEIPQGFRAIALSDDGIIEAIVNEEKKIYGVQFHPERMSFSHRRQDTVDGENIFRFFLSIL